MTKARLIKRLSWYYPTEKFHAYVTFPGMLVYFLVMNPLQNMLLMSYGLVVCTVILYQGQHYWKLKLHGLRREPVEQERNLRFFENSKKLNWVLIAFMVPVFVIQLNMNGWNIQSNDMFWWGILVNLFAIGEHINYYYIQLMVDNPYDVAYIKKNKRLKEASLAKDLSEGRI